MACAALYPIPGLYRGQWFTAAWVESTPRQWYVHWRVPACNWEARRAVQVPVPAVVVSLQLLLWPQAQPMCGSMSADRYYCKYAVPVYNSSAGILVCGQCTGRLDTLPATAVPRCHLGGTHSLSTLPLGCTWGCGPQLPVPITPGQEYAHWLAPACNWKAAGLYTCWFRRSCCPCNHCCGPDWHRATIAAAA